MSLFRIVPTICPVPNWDCQDEGKGCLKKKKALSDSKGLTGTSVFCFLLKLLVWGGAGNLWL